MNGEDLQSKNYFDIVLSLLQVLPAFIILIYNFFDVREVTKEAMEAIRRGSSSLRRSSAASYIFKDKQDDEEQGSPTSGGGNVCTSIKKVSSNDTHINIFHGVQQNSKVSPE